MKFYNNFFIFILLTLLPHFSQADQLVMRYSGLWPNTLNIRWDNEKMESLGWMQFHAKAEKQSDGSSKCAIYCQRTASEAFFVAVVGLDSTGFECSLLKFEASIDEAVSKIYNQIIECNVQNGQVVWPLYDEVVKTYQSNGKDTIVKNFNRDKDNEPQKMEPVFLKK